jgi:hypothetical protein
MRVFSDFDALEGGGKGYCADLPSVIIVQMHSDNDGAMKHVSTYPKSQP